VEESDQKEELLEQLQEATMRLDSHKSKKANNKKEITTLVKQHKTEVQKLQDEIKAIQNNWVEPSEVDKLAKKEKELDSQVKTLKEDLARKRDLINSLKTSQEKKEQKAVEMVSKVDSRKEDLEKIMKLSREVARKETMAKELKTQYDEIKEKEAKSQQEVKSLQVKLKTLKADISRKETMLKDTKDKLQTEIKETKQTESKTIDIAKHKDIVKKYKQDIERKDFKISSLESKLDTNASEMEKLKNESVIEAKSSKSEYFKESKKYETSVKKMRKLEEASQNAVLVLRRMMKEMILSVEKLRSEVIISRHETCQKSWENFRQNSTHMQTPNKLSNMHSAMKPTQAVDNTMSDMYKESLDILGVSLGELEEFVQPAQSPTMKDKLPILDYANDPSWVSSSKNTVGPGLDFEDLGHAHKDNRDLEVFTKVLNAIVNDPEKLNTESEDIIQIFKKLLKEIKSLEGSMSAHKANAYSSENMPQKAVYQQNTSNNKQVEEYIKESDQYLQNMFN